MQWIQLQRQKEPIVHNLVQEYQKSQAILQTPEYLAEYHDRFFDEVVEIPQRNVQLYRNLLTDPNLLAKYVRYFYENVRPDLVEAVDRERRQGQTEPTLDVNQSFLGYQLTPQQVTGLKNQLVAMFQNNAISDQVYFSRMRELEVINDPARQSMLQTRVTQPQQGIIPQQVQQQQLPQQPQVPPTTVAEAKAQAQQQAQQGFQPSMVQRPAFPSMPAQAGAQVANQPPVNLSALPPWQRYQVAQQMMRTGGMTVS